MSSPFSRVQCSKNTVVLLCTLENELSIQNILGILEPILFCFVKQQSDIKMNMDLYTQKFSVNSKPRPICIQILYSPEQEVPFNSGI